MKRKKTIETYNKIVEAYKADPKGFRKWADDNGYRYSLIKAALEESGHTIPKRKKGRASVHGELYNKIISYYHQDPLNFWNWVDRNGYTNAIVRRAFLIHKVDYPKKGYKEVRRETKTPKSIHIIAGLLEGKSQQEIAGELGCSRQYAELVYTWAVNAGIKF